MSGLNFSNPWHSFLTNTGVREQSIDHIEKNKIVGHHANLEVIVGKTIQSLGFNGKNYIFPCREFKIHGSHLKPAKYVQWI